MSKQQIQAKDIIHLYSSYGVIIDHDEEKDGNENKLQIIIESQLFFF